MLIKYRVIHSTIPKLDECAAILFNIRKYERYFHEQGGGYQTRKNLKYWQDKADEWLRDNTEQIKEDQ